MADVKIPGLPELTTIAGEDLLEIIDDPSGTPTSKKITRTNLVKGLVSDDVYAADWDGVTDVAPSKNAVYDKFEANIGDVYGPITHLASYVPQWNATPNSKTLVEGFEITDAGKAILDDVDAAAQRTTLGCPTDPAVDTAGLRTLGTGAQQAMPGNSVSSDAVIKGWISFNGTGTIAIRSSFNVTSITDYGTGDYGVNWDTDFANTNHCVTGMAGGSYAAYVNVIIYSVATGSARVRTYMQASGAPTLTDIEIICVMAIGDQ